MTIESISMTGRGARGESFADIARRLGAIGSISVAPTDTDAQVMSALADASAVAGLEFSSPFIVDVGDTYLRALVKDIYIEGGDAGHQYILNYETQNLGAGNGRVRFTVRDITLGIDVCTGRVIDTQANIVARATPTVFTYQDDLAGYTGITATLWIDWSAIVWGGGITTYTTAAQSGVRGDRTITPGEMRERFKRGAEPKISLTVGAGTVTATHFNTVLAAVQSLYLPGLTVTRSTYPLSDICSFSNQVLVEVVDDAYSEDIALVTIATVDQSPLVLPPFMTLRLRSDSRVYSDEATNTGPTIEAPFPFCIEGGTVECAGKGYAVHIDNQNDRAKRATVGPAVLRYPMVSVMRGGTLKGNAANLTWTIGCGISNGQTILLDGCRVIGGAAQPQLGVHNVPTTTDPGEIEVIDTYFNAALVTGATAISLLKSAAMTVQHRLNVKGSDADEIQIGNSIGGASGFIRVGKIDPAITVTGTLDT